MKSINLLFTLSRLGIGGIQTFVIQLANHMVKTNDLITPSIFCYYPELASSDNNIKIDDRIKIYTLTNNTTLIKIINLSSSLILNFFPRWSLKEFLIKTYYFKLIKKERIDLVHSNIFITDNLAIKSKLRINLPFITTAHGSYDEENINKSKLELMSMIGEHSDMYVYMADKNLANFRKHEINLPNKRFIPYGFNHSTIRNNNQNIEPIIKFCMVARGSVDKGWIQLNEAISILKSKNLEFEVHIAADENLVNKLFANRNSENIFYYGSISDPLSLIEKCNVGILPTYLSAETMPFTVIEYLYHSKPVISTDLGSIKWMVKHNEEIGGEILSLNGRGIIDSHELAEKMKQYIKNKKKLIYDSKIANQAFNKFSITTCSEAYTKLYKETL